MSQDRYRQAFRNISICLFVVWLSHNGPPLLISLIDGCGKLIGLLVLASLLMFVVSHSADICKAAMAFAQSLPTSLFLLVPGYAPGKQLPADVVLPIAPSLSPRFQRPPPCPSL
jgi:hypothetical protein